MENFYIPVVLITGDDYILPTSVAINSIIKNKKKNTFYKFILLYDFLSDENKSKLELFISNDIDIEFLRPSNADYLLSIREDNSYTSSAVLFKFVISEILYNYDKVLYLDSDVIVKGDLSELYNTDINDYYIAAVKDVHPIMFEHHKKYNLETYYNAGVLLYNIKQIRLDNLNNILNSEQVINITKQYPFFEQDTYNIYFKDKIKSLHPKYNFIIESWFRYGIENCINIFDIKHNEGKRLFSNAVIYHLASPRKPWIYRNGLMRNEWIKYFKLLPFKSLTIKNQYYNNIDFKKEKKRPLFDIYNKDDHKILKIFDLTIKFKNYKKIIKRMDSKILEIENKHTNEINNLKKNLFYTILKQIPNYDVKYLFSSNTKQITVPLNVEQSEIKPLKKLFNANLINYNSSCLNSDAYLLWGIKLIGQNYNNLNAAYQYNKPLYVMEDGFLKCVATPQIKTFKQEYRNNLSYTINNKVPYFDCTDISLLERLLNDKDLIITSEQKLRARMLIEKIVNNKLTKYNHQPIYKPNIGRVGVKKILLIDQSYGDMAIVRGNASDLTFKKMLECALQENPNADIIIKTHPDVVAGSVKGYFSDLKLNNDNVILYTENINPLCLIDICDEVYVCTSQMGFEALMCNKKVHVFGISFYSGYGLTNDRQVISRRQVKRTLEEMFYIIYILFSYYVDPITQKRCEIEDIIDYIIEKRDEMFKVYNIKCSIDTEKLCY